MTTSIYVSGLHNPRGLALDSLGNFYCANHDNNTISKISSDGSSLKTFVKSGNGLNKPIGLAFDAEGNLYCANNGNNTISKISSNGTVTSFVTNGLNKPYALAFDSAGNLYCSNNGNGVISKISPIGTVTTFVDTFLGTGLFGLAFYNNELYYIVGDLIKKINANLSSSTVFSISGNSLRMLSITSEGIFYVSAGTQRAIFKIITDSNKTTINVETDVEGLVFSNSQNVLYYCTNLEKKINKMFFD